MQRLQAEEDKLIAAEREAQEARMIEKKARTLFESLTAAYGQDFGRGGLTTVGGVPPFSLQ